MAQNSIPDNTIDPNLLASYEAMYPALTDIINVQRNISKMEGPVYKNIDGGGGIGFQNPVGKGNVFGGKIGDDSGGKEYKGNISEHLAYEADERDKTQSYVPSTFNATVTSPPFINTSAAEKAREIANEAEEAAKAGGPLGAVDTAVRPGGITWDREDKATTGTFNPPMISGVGATVTPGGTTRTVDRRDYAVNRDVSNPAVNDLRDAGAITEGLDDNTKVELANVTAQANKLLTSKGWSDSGNWGYARTRNMLTGGGLGPVVTEGAMVPWKSQGQDASSADYISNVGGGDIFPSRLSEADRLKSGGGELSFVPEGQKVDYLRQNYGTSGGGEGRTPFNEFLSSADNVDSASLNIAITNFNRLKTHEFTANTFTGVDTTKGFVETLLSPVKGLADAAENLLTFVTDGLGISDSDVKDPGFFKWLNTPLDAISTTEVGIKPLDIIMIAAGGVTGLTAVAVGKVMGGILKPFTSRIKGTFKQLLSGDTEKLSDTDKKDAVNEWERIMNVEAGEEDTNTYDPSNKLDVITSGDFFISDPDRDAADQAKNWLLDGFESGNVLNLSGQRVAVFTDSFGNSVNVHNTNIDSRTSDIILGPNNQAYGVRDGNAYAITTNGQPVTMGEWNNGKVSGTGSGGGGGVLKTLWEWATSKQE